MFIGFCSLVTSQNGMQVLQMSSAPVDLHHVSVTSQKKGFTSVSVTYTSRDPVEPSWTIDEGFTPQYFNPTTFESIVKHKNGSTTATIDLPKDLSFNVIRFHLVCEQQSFVVHLALRVTYGMAPTFEKISQYSLFVPPSSEIGISSRGEARFHTMVNNSGTSFSFGMLQTEAALLSSLQNDPSRTYYDSNAAYSFLPDDRSKVVRLRKVIETAHEYHADVIVKSNKIFKDGAVISVLAACTNPSSLINRMDIKQVRYVHPTGTTTPVKADSLGFIQEDFNLFVEKNQNALIRCTAIGNPRPQITLHKKDKKGHGPALKVPQHMTVLKYKFSAVFHIFNVDETKIGEYVCVASNGNRKVESAIHTLSLINQQMIQESLK